MAEVVKESRLITESKDIPQQRRLSLQPSDKPKLWEHVFEFVIPQRSYRLFSNSYDVKEQWVYAISEYLIFR